MATSQSINLGLPAQPLVQDQDMYYELLRVYNAIRLVLQAVDNNTGAISPDKEYWDEIGFSRLTIGNMSKIYPIAGESLDYGSTVGIGADGKAYKAQGGVRACVGFCSVVGGSLIDEHTEIQLIGLFPPFTSGTLTPGSGYYQSTTAGVIGVAGSGAQFVGYALSDTQLYFNPQF